MADEIFDPEIHATDKDGNPSLNKDGSFRKKRKDAGKRAAPSGPRPASSSGGNSARERYKRSVDQILGIPVTVASIKDPVLGYACGELAPMWSAGLADLAMDYPQLAAALEKGSNLGSAGALLGAALLTGVQLGHLMGKVPAHMVKMMGGRTREEIEQILQQRGVELAEQAKRQAQWDAEEAETAEEIRRMTDAEKTHAGV